ncbi:hypothetical protein GE09DRAFT_1100289 [Coniochaeta sp. 2T2.1]|nr:hypothetical protein GE09DRAFT_1100289 [Coniochaeta sp. 2T2.1]
MFSASEALILVMLLMKAEGTLRCGWELGNNRVPNRKGNHLARRSRDLVVQTWWTSKIEDTPPAGVRSRELLPRRRRYTVIRMSS